MTTVQEFGLCLSPELQTALGRSEMPLSLVTFQGSEQGFIPHFHSYAVLGKIEGGHRLCRVHSLYADRPVSAPVKAGDLVLFHPGQIHSCLCEDSSPLFYRAIQIPADLYDAISTDAGFQPSIYRLEDCPTLCRSFNELWTALEQQAPYACQSLTRFFEQLSALCKAPNRPKKRELCRSMDPEIRQALVCLEQNLSSPLRLPDLWTQLRLSRSAFYRKWSASLFITPLQYRNCLRTERSQQLLRAGFSQAASAAELGWSDQSEFARWFVRIHGYTPGQFCRAGRTPS